MARTAIIFDNFGPYHLGRLEAAARVCDLLAVEVNECYLEHLWTTRPGAIRFQAVTLAQGAGSERLGVRGLSNRLRKVFAEFKPQVVFLPGWSCAGAFVAQHWCGTHSVPCVVMSESNSWDEKRRALKEWVKCRLSRMYAAALVGGAHHKNYLTKMGMAPERVFLGYDAVDNDYFASKVEEARNQRSGASGRSGLPERYFLASARFVEKKNLPGLIQAYARYRALCEDRKAQTADHRSSVGNDPLSSIVAPAPWDLVLLGDGPLKSDLCRLITDLHLDACVHLPGFKEYNELPKYYALASAFVHASTTEQWGLVVNEAMASGLPVLVSNRCGCAADLVREGINGFTFDPYKVHQVAELMLNISAVNSPLAAYGAESKRIIADWGPQRFAQGVSAAVAEAKEVAAPRISLFDRMLLQILAVSSL